MGFEPVTFVVQTLYPLSYEAIDRMGAGHIWGSAITLKCVY